jgi:hypothetical protein
MRVLDTPLSHARGRTPRELLIIAGGTAALVQGILHGSNTGNLIIYALMTVAFASRFFAARIMMGGLFIGALALHLPWLLYDGFGVTDLAPVVWALAAGLVLVSSRDLIERFDNNEAGGIPGFPNFWMKISRSHRRAFSWCAYSLGALGGLLYHAWLRTPADHAPDWALWALAGAIACTLLIIAGRSLAFVATGIYSAWILTIVVPQVGSANTLLEGNWTTEISAMYLYSPHYVLPAAIAAAAALAISVPYALKWLSLVIPTLFDRRRKLAD